jgi:hypothetical protein
VKLGNPRPDSGKRSSPRRSLPYDRPEEFVAALNRFLGGDHQRPRRPRTRQQHQPAHGDVTVAGHASSPTRRVKGSATASPPPATGSVGGRQDVLERHLGGALPHGGAAVDEGVRLQRRVRGARPDPYPGRSRSQSRRALLRRGGREKPAIERRIGAVVRAPDRRSADSLSRRTAAWRKSNGSSAI